MKPGYEIKDWTIREDWDDGKCVAMYNYPGTQVVAYSIWPYLPDIKDNPPFVVAIFKRKEN